MVFFIHSLRAVGIDIRMNPSDRSEIVSAALARMRRTNIISR